MFAMSRQLKGALMAAGGGVCWGISGTMGQYLFTHEAMQTTWLIPIRLSLAGLILFVYWLVKDRRLLFAPWRQRDSAVMLVLYGIFGISLSQFLLFSDHSVFQRGHRHDHAGSVAGDGAAGRLRDCAQKAARV